MARIILIFIAATVFACHTATIDYYIVRHEEKASVDSITKSSDVPLSDKGKKRAEGLKEELKSKNIRYIYSTNTIRTKMTAEPLSKAIGTPIEIYDGSDNGFIDSLKTVDGNVLIIGHANTIDNVVNGLTGKPLLKELKDNQYGDLFIVHKKGNNTSYEVKRFGPLINTPGLH